MVPDGGDGSVGLTGDARTSASSRNEHERESAGLGDSVSIGSREGRRLPRSGGTDASGGGEGSDKRPEVKSREYWWNGMSVSEENTGSGVQVEGRM